MNEEKLEAGIGLCLSGGGYRAMVFHLGAIWRLYESGLLGKAKRISSVSGGSITAGMLGLKWGRLGGIDDYVREVVEPVRALALETIDVESILLGLALPGRISERVVDVYEKHLYGEATLQDLPDEPRFVINATNVQSGALWRFEKPYMGDYRVGLVPNPDVKLARAVAASSAFPPVLSPLELDLEPLFFTPGTGEDLQFAPYTSRVYLSDGGVYDNLGMESVWKRYETVLVSDAGTKLEAEAEPKSDWLQHTVRILMVIDNQVRSLRKRELIGGYINGERKGAYWGVGTDISNYELADALPCPIDRTMDLAALPTRLKAIEDDVQERLINWGYAVCDAALRKHVDGGLPAGKFPYEGGV
jgi:NTE family protein